MSPFTKIAELLGVDEVRVAHGLNNSTVSIRIGDTWLAASLDSLVDSKNMNGEIVDILMQLTEGLRRSLNLADAKGEDLDRLASMMGVTRVPEQRRPMNRFEAVAEELKKL